MYKYVPRVYEKIKSKGINTIDDIFNSVKSDKKTSKKKKSE